jgi:hypothetical protein
MLADNWRPGDQAGSDSFAPGCGSVLAITGGAVRLVSRCDGNREE